MELIAPSPWRRIDFISDLHLQQQDTATFDLWRSYLHSAQTDALFILGDLFEVWVGDDVLRIPTGFERQCADAIAQAALRIPVYVMQGNRDFLMGAGLMQSCGATLLDDPTVLQWAEHRWLLTHGDALCLADVSYQAFRQQVRSPQWQQTFLSQPLPQRIAFARSLREQSEARKRETTTYADVDTTAALEWMDAQQAQTMIHGHTHRPAVHLLDALRNRYVLSDWDGMARPPRAEVLRWTWSGNPTEQARAERLSIASPAG
jgi:UDP-2,3-diacylglucosamine hydrolase